MNAQEILDKIKTLNVLLDELKEVLVQVGNPGESHHIQCKYLTELIKYKNLKPEVEFSSGGVHVRCLITDIDNNQIRVKALYDQ